MASNRPLSHYSTTQGGAESDDHHAIFTPPSGWATVPGGSLGLSSTTLPIAPTDGSTAASLLAPLRAVVGSVFASSGTMTQTVKPTSSSSKTRLNNLGGAKDGGDRGSDGGETRPPGEGGAEGGDGSDGGNHVHGEESGMLIKRRKEGSMGTTAGRAQTTHHHPARAAVQVAQAPAEAARKDQRI